MGRKRTLRKRNPQGPEKSVFILLLSMLSAKIIICQQQKICLQEHSPLGTGILHYCPTYSSHSLLNLIITNTAIVLLV